MKCSFTVIFILKIMCIDNFREFGHEIFGDFRLFIQDGNMKDSFTECTTFVESIESISAVEFGFECGQKSLFAHLPKGSFFGEML